MNGDQTNGRDGCLLPKVLLVDDVEANLIAVEALLEGLSCLVVRAQSGDQALRYMLKDDFAVVLLDVQMPEMDGYEVAHHARQDPATREVPIIFLTATSHTEQNELRGYGSGAVDFLFKPVDPTILRSKVGIFLDLYSSRQQIAEAKADLESKNKQLESAYRELKETQSHLVQSAKMASLGKLVAGVAHEINNPLAFITSHLGTVQRSLNQVQPDDGALCEAERAHWERAQNRLSEMTLGLERIRELVVKLRTFSRLDEGERKAIRVSECLDSVLTILRHRLKEDIDVEQRLDGQEPLECYPGLLNQALLNVVANAIDAIEGKGKIEVSTRQDENGYTIEIADSGTGIPADVRERVMEPFFTTKPVGQGTGLGLSITYSIIQKHGGSFELLPREPQGTRAIIRLPLNQSRK